MRWSTRDGGADGRQARAQRQILRKLLIMAIGMVALLIASSKAFGLVLVTESKPEERRKADGTVDFSQSVGIANELASYELTYEITRDEANPGQVTSNWWAWTTRMTTLGMTYPSRANFYFQGFFNWTFDDESLHLQPAMMNVIRHGGQDGVVEYVWDMPAVTVRIRFAMADGSDKLLMFGDYEPKRPVTRSQLRFGIYPTGFSQPRNRAVTTSQGTILAGGLVDLNLGQERWLLAEDVTKGRPGDGSAGIVIGTPGSFSSVAFSVGSYGIFPNFTLKPEARSFALALYSCPILPDTNMTRDYFRATGDDVAQWLQAVAAAGIDKQLPPGKIDGDRMHLLRKRIDKMFERPTERWAPRAEPIDIPWAANLPGGGIETVVFTYRYAAWEVMELARRLDVKVDHLYFDRPDEMADPKAWPYAGQTGIGIGPMATRALALLQQNSELLLMAGIRGTALPQLVRDMLLQAVRDGAGMLITGDPAGIDSWPEELFAMPAPELVKDVLAGVDWRQIPGYRLRNNSEPKLPLKVYRFGKGRILTLTAGFSRYAPLVPRSNETEGLEGGFDRALAVVARAALAVANRKLPVRLTPMLADGELSVAFKPAPPEGASLRLRIQDDLDRTLQIADVPLPILGGSLKAESLPMDRDVFVDLVLTDSNGRTLGYAMIQRPRAAEDWVSELSIEPSTQVHDAAPPMVDLPEGGLVRVAAHVRSGERQRRLVWTIDDIIGRRLASGESPVPAGGGMVEMQLTLTRPVTVPHVLSAQLLEGKRELAYQRRTFTIPLSYPYDDFTALLWTYTGGDAVLRRTMRESYNRGVDMQDLSHVGGYDSARAAREFAVAAASGLRLIPYITRIAGETDVNNVRYPELYDPVYREQTRESVARVALQARPYAPAAFTLGDENYLNRGVYEMGRGEHTVTAFQKWLQEKYGTIAALNAVWTTNLASFGEITKPLMIDEAVNLSESFAPWLDKWMFLDTAFADIHRYFADAIREQVPGAKVGWDGLLGYTFKSGYDFTKLTDGLELNQTYAHRWNQGELVRSFKQDDALTGKWGNMIVENEAAFRAWPWDSVFSDDNSIWWWTSWGLDYVPFDPDLKISSLGRGWFEGIQEVKAGPAKLLLNATRDHSGIGILYSQADIHVGALLDAMSEATSPFIGDSSVLREHTWLMHALHDLGYQYRHFSREQLADGVIDPATTPVLILNYATMLSGADVAALWQYVKTGGHLIANGRIALLDGNGKLYETRPLDGLLGVQSPAGRNALVTPSKSVSSTIEGTIGGAPAGRAVHLIDAAFTVVEPGLQLVSGSPLAELDGTPVVVVNQVGRGQAILLNLALSGLEGERLEPGLQPHEALLEAAVGSAGIRPFAELTTPEGNRPLITQVVHYTDGENRYLGVQQDFNQSKAGDQRVQITIPKEAVVYDIRKGERVGTGMVRSWALTISRTKPHIYALLPYEVTGVTITAVPTAQLGQTVSIEIGVQAKPGRPGRHIVRLDVFAPNTTRAHREYSQNIEVIDGNGIGTIPFALNDLTGEWTFVARDVASGWQAAGRLNIGR